jgi:hypothetical protein
MSDLLIFFGSSEGFNYDVYDENGIYKLFDKQFPDFENFESKIFSIDRSDNKPILAKYRLNVNGKNISLLKYYAFAQSSFSSRIEGSNIGVAFLSFDDLALNKKNYILLKNLLLIFQEKALTNNKFNSGNFSNIVNNIFEEFKNTNSFSLIDKIQFRANSTSKNSSIGFYVNEINEITFSRVPDTYDRIYLTADKDHLKRVFENNSEKFNVWYIDEKNTLTSLREQNEIKKIEEQKLKQIKNNYGSNSNATNYNNAANYQNELIRDEFNQLKNRYQLVLKKKKFLTTIIGALSILLLISLLFNIFKRDNQKKELVISNTNNLKTQNIQNSKPDFNEIAISFIDSIISDKEKLKNFTSFLLYINNIKNQKITNITFEQFDESKLNIEGYGIFEFDEVFFKKHQINLTNTETTVPKIQKNDPERVNPKKDKK